jgi:HAD superfamily hydrolase (TIGR01509 family)
MTLKATKQLEAILFDMDGVLADTERDGHRPAFNQAFAENDLETVWDVERYGVLLETGGGKERMTAHWNEVGWPKAMAEMDEKSRQEKVKELHLRKTEIFNDMIRTGEIPLRPGVIRIVDDAIAADLRLAVCSTSSELAVRNLVQTLLGPDRAARFQIFAGDMVKRKKPAPDVYNMAVEQMVLDKSKCVIVEDSGIGWQSAKAAGIACIVTKSSYTKDENFSGANMVVDELGDDPATGITLETLEGLLKQTA